MTSRLWTNVFWYSRIQANARHLPHFWTNGPVRSKGVHPTRLDHLFKNRNHILYFYTYGVLSLY